MNNLELVSALQRHEMFSSGCLVALVIICLLWWFDRAGKNNRISEIKKQSELFRKSIEQKDKEIKLLQIPDPLLIDKNGVIDHLDDVVKGFQEDCSTLYKENKALKDKVSRLSVFERMYKLSGVAYGILKQENDAWKSGFNAWRAGFREKEKENIELLAQNKKLKARLKKKK